MHPAYNGTSRARWLCTLKTAVRIQLGILLLLLYGHRRHLDVVLPMGPASIHTAAAHVQKAGGRWQMRWLFLLKLYWDPLSD